MEVEACTVDQARCSAGSGAQLWSTAGAGRQRCRVAPQLWRPGAPARAVAAMENGHGNGTRGASQAKPRAALVSGRRVAWCWPGSSKQREVMRGGGPAPAAVTTAVVVERGRSNGGKEKARMRGTAKIRERTRKQSSPIDHIARSVSTTPSGGTQRHTRFGFGAQEVLGQVW